MGDLGQLFRTDRDKRDPGTRDDSMIALADLLQILVNAGGRIAQLNSHVEITTNSVGTFKRSDKAMVTKDTVELIGEAENFLDKAVQALNKATVPPYNVRLNIPQVRTVDQFVDVCNEAVRALRKTQERLLEAQGNVADAKGKFAAAKGGSKSGVSTLTKEYDYYIEQLERHGLDIGQAHETEIPTYIDEVKRLRR